MWRGFRTVFGTQIGPKRFLNLQKTNTDVFVLDQMRRGFRTLFVGTRMGLKSVPSLQKLNTDSFFLIRCGGDSEHCFGTRMGPTSVLNLQKLNADSFVFDQMWRGFRTLLLDKVGANTFSGSSKA